MVIHELTDAQCRDLLARAGVGRLACARAGQPYIVPILYYFDLGNDCLYSFSTLGQKIRWMRDNPKVCVEVDEVVDQFHWTTVVIVGRYEEVADVAQHRDARRRAHELFAQRREWWLPGAGKLTSGDEHAIPVLYRILIERMSGRRAARGGRS
jgi:nitroimidazol reductase NimA-like FMN-containing flavoprotein (pyridoxamine 5'-phosphate oxidase superfamily)